jgi:hypothetical protein
MWIAANQRPVPWGLVVDHLCYNRKCGNPDHLEPKSVHENSKRIDPDISKRKTASPTIAPYDFCNLDHPPETRDGYTCRECNKLRRRAYIAIQRAGRSAAGLTEAEYHDLHRRQTAPALDYLHQHGIRPADVITEAGLDLDDILRVSPSIALACSND